MTGTDQKLNGRVALVTGGARGIGRAIVESLLQHGAKVSLVDNGTSIDGTGNDRQAVTEEALKLGDKALVIADSIASPDAAAAAVRRTIDRFGGIDIVVNNAAILRDAFIFKGNPADWEAVIRNNLSGAYYLLAAATPVMRDQAKSGRGGAAGYRWGRIINMVSSVGLYGNFGQAAYASAKAGLVGLTRVVAMDLARSNITCNAIAPFAATRVTYSIKPQNPAQESYKERALKISPSHVANVVSWLCSDSAREITGQLFGVRGREVFLFSQPRPVARLAGSEDWNIEGLERAAAQQFAPHYTSLATDLETFDTEPLV